jgi:hypothetical protein
MTEKERVTQWLYPGDKKRLKMLAAESDKPVGDVINDLLNFVHQTAEQRRQLIQKAGGASIARQPMLSLALMSDRAFCSMVEAPETGYDWEPMGDEEW